MNYPNNNLDLRQDLKLSLDMTRKSHSAFRIQKLGLGMPSKSHSGFKTLPPLARKISFQIQNWVSKSPKTLNSNRALTYQETLTKGSKLSMYHLGPDIGWAYTNNCQD